MTLSSNLINNDSNVWIHFVDFTNNSDDYSVTDWTAAKHEAAIHIKHGLHFVVSEADRIAIISKIETSEWLDAVELYNKNNAMHEHLLFREGQPVFS